jgi:hypothetical protein
MFRQLKNKLLWVIVFTIMGANAEQAVNADINVQNQPTASAPVLNKQPAQQLTVKSSALTSADNDANQLQEIQRKQAIKDALNKFNSAVGGQDKNSSMGQTTATNIIINEDGYKSATLQFIDGSTLDVEPGTKIGKYVVDDVSMSGVTLHEINCRKKCASKLIKRAYPKRPVTNNASPSVNYQSTPVVNDQGVNSNQEQVPPIVNAK